VFAEAPLFLAKPVAKNRKGLENLLLLAYYPKGKALEF